MCVVCCVVSVQACTTNRHARSENREQVPFPDKPSCHMKPYYMEIISGFLRNQIM